MNRHTFEAKVGKQGNVLGALFTLGEGGKDQEASPALAFADSDRLPTDGQRIHVAFGNIVALHDASGTNGLVSEVDERQDDANGKDPFGDVERNGGLDGGGPAVKGDELDGGEAVDRVDGNGDDEREPEIAVGKGRTTARGFKVL